MSVSQILNNFLNELKKIDNDEYVNIKTGLNPPATDLQIKTLEKELGVKLPSDYKELLKLHNGSDWLNPVSFFIHNYDFMSLEQIDGYSSSLNNFFLKDYDGHMKITSDKGVKSVYWNKNWIPISYDGAGNHHCIDLDPASGGHKEQIISYYHDDEHRSLLALDFKTYFEQCLNEYLEYVKEKKEQNNKPKEEKKKGWLW